MTQEKEQSRKTGLERRDFLKGAGLAAAVPLVLPATGSLAKENQDERIKPRYRETEEVKRFYDLNRL